MTRQNTSEDSSPAPSSGTVCTVYSMTRTVIAGPSLLRGGFSSARYVPSGRTFTGRKAKAAEARHKMCAPVARKARARDQDKNFRSASTSIPGPRHPSRSRASGCSADRYGPMAAPSRLPVPDSAATTHRTCGNAPSRDWFDGRPKNATFLPLSGTSVVDPSIDTTRSPQQKTPGAPSAPVGPATCSNSIRTGSGPSLPRPRDSEEMFGCRHRRPCPASTQPPGSSYPRQQVRPAPLVVQAVGQLGHHLPVPAVPAPEQPQGQHEIHHQPGRQQPPPLLPRPGDLDDLIHQLRRERPRQHPDRDPVRQPAVRRQTLRTIMSHKTVTISHQALRQGHWAGGPSRNLAANRRSACPQSLNMVPDYQGITMITSKDSF